MNFYLEENGAVTFAGAPQILTEYIEKALTPDELATKREESHNVLVRAARHPNIVFMKTRTVIGKDFFGQNIFSALRFHKGDDLLSIANQLSKINSYLVVVSSMFYVKETFYNCFLVGGNSNIERKIRLYFIDDILDTL